MLSEKERHKLLYEFNDTGADFPRDKVLQELFEEQAEKTPHATAIVFKDKKLTYRELNERSNQLARTLRGKSVRPDQIAGLMVDDNTTEMVIGIISVLKAGGAFLPIDPNFPKERIEYMLKDSNLAVLLTQGRLRDEIRFEGEVINLDNESSFTEGYSNLDKINQSNDLAYVIYTSGSTGKPKGVQIEHSSIVNQIVGLKKRYHFNDSLRHILLAPVTFDPSVQQIILPLISGGRLFLVSKATKHNVKELWNYIGSNRINVINTVPSLMNALLDYRDSSDDSHFKYIILAGEVFFKNLYAKMKEKLSAEKIINIYGPTEATINTTLYECKAEEMGRTIPIGKPLMNYRVLILSEDEKLVPIGGIGEICISGVGLARGYLNNPELTAEKFVINPFIRGERMYRTGDLGRWTEDGNIEFLGRIDDQVKVRGIRVELGEVEAALGQNPGVKESIVISQGEMGVSRGLVAYVVPNQERRVGINELRRSLEEKLPDYMIPSAFVIMDALPLTGHGKVDRRALPEPEAVRQGPEESFVAPREELESQIINIWENVLGIKHIGVRDDFFNLGGSSLLAMVLFAQIEKIFGKNLPLATIFDAPTPEDLAKIIATGKWVSDWSPLVAIQPRGGKAPFFCVHGHRGNVIGFYDLARHLGADQPFYALQAEGLNGKPVGKRRIENIAANYINEIRRVQPKGPYFLGGWCMGGILAFEMAHLLREKGEEVGLLAMIESNRPGTPKYLANSSLGRRLFYKIIDRVDYEVRALRAVGTEGKLFHIWGKIKALMTAMQVGVEKMLDSVLDKFTMTMVHSWPYRLNALCEAHEEGIVNYKPRPYQGRIAIFRAGKQPLGVYPDPSLGWSELVTGVVELHEIPGHHLNIFLIPSVPILAEKLKTCIDEAQRMI